MGNMTKKAKVWFLAACMTIMSCFSAFAAEATIVSATDWQPILDAITPQISVTTIVGVLAACITSVIGIVFMWWGARKALKTFMAAFRKGRASV